MQCPKCKKEIDEKSLKCPFCKARVGSLCKKCGEYNPITVLECHNCGEILVKKCPECGSANLPLAKKCRKCGVEFIKQESLNNKENLTYYASMNSQQKVKSKLLEGIKDAESKVITLSGESGIGKNLVLRYVVSELKNAKLIWLLGTCTQITQLSPFGYFQDVLLNFFNINNFSPDTLQLKKNSMKFFKQDFPVLTNGEIIDLLNLLYPENMDKYENIYFNKAKMFSIIKKVFQTIIEKMKVVFIVDKFENIDGMSYDFIKELMNDEFINERCKFVLITSNSKPGLGLITAKELVANNYLDLSIAPFTQSHIETFLKQYSNFNLDKDYRKLVIKYSKGNPAIIEQMILLNEDIKRCKLKTAEFTTIESVIAQRLKILKTENIKAYRFLIAASVLGVKFFPAMLENFDNISPDEFEKIIDLLTNLGYITRLNNLSFEFKSTDIWKTIVSIIKSDDTFDEILNRLYEGLSIYKQSSIALIAYILQKLNNNDQAFTIWTLLMKQSTYIGDIGLYIIAQKQSLKLIENKNSAYYNKIKKNINTRIGKLLEPIDHNTAFEYIKQAIMMLDENADFEHIELLGYLASCSIKDGNYCGAIECTESVLNKIPVDMKFEQTLVKSRMITPLLKLGNYGQLINMIETELLTDLEKVLSKGRDTSVIKIKDLFELWVGIYFNYAEALVFQGDNRAFDVIKSIYEILDKNQNTEPANICRANLLLALANTIKGDFNLSAKILDDMLKEYSLDNMDSFIVSRWNFIDIVNKFFEKDYNSLQLELFNVVAYANNVNDNFTKNILKTLLAKMLNDNNQLKKALEILEKQVAYFAKEKVATGVLLSWYLIATIKLITNGTQFALDIATKALDIAQSPNINNYYFIAMFNKLIGEIYLAKQDFESAKVYIEKSIFIAKQFDLQYIQVKAYLLSAKLYQELALPKSSMRSTYIKQALKMFQLAKNVSIVAEQTILQKCIREDLNILTSFCKLNGIVLKKGS